MSVQRADGAWEHLYPDFRRRLRAVFADCAERGLHLKLFEGYRSPARQLWLYQQGRTRPGAIVTYRKDPKFHGKGLAADCYPMRDGEMVWAFTERELAIYREAQARHGIGPTAMKGDYGHTELKADAATLKAAAAWVKAGFPAMPDAEAPAPHERDAVPVRVLGKEIKGTVDSGATWLDTGELLNALGVARRNNGNQTGLRSFVRATGLKLSGSEEKGLEVSL